jgi:NitT/TauT family transport system substrate-binding protein
MDLAETLGFYQREGLDVEIVRVQQTPLALAALHNGFGDMANVSVTGVLQAIARGEMRLKAVVSPDRTISFLIAGRRGIGSINALEGATLGIGRIGSLDYSLTRLVLSRLGIDVDKVKLAAMGEPHIRAQALLTGRIDATTMSTGLWSSLPEKTGLHVVLAADEYFRAAPVLNKVNVVDARLLSTRRDAIERFIAAIVKASRTFAAHPEIWAEAMRVAHPEVPLDQLDALARDYAGAWSVNGGLSRRQIDATIEEDYRQAEFEGLRRVPFQEWIEPGPLDAVLARLGTAAGDAPDR